MLAARRGFYDDGKEIISTPLLLPSFSSKGFPKVQDILSLTQEVIDGGLLVSAYDLSYGLIRGPFDFAQAIFLDSGGYEAGKDVELSELNGGEYTPSAWSLEKYQKALSSWTSSRPTVMVSYDHPQDRRPLKEQIARAHDTIPKAPNIFREILLKPQENGQDFVNATAIAEMAQEFSCFDAIGVTEKELGATIRTRMENIATLRRALNESNQKQKPIHIFGSLDTISTPLYFVSGADVFDGLTWLRFAYHDGLTIYRQNFAAARFGLDLPLDVVDLLSWRQNYRYLGQMQREMRAFSRTGSFASFGHNAALIEQAYKSIEAPEEV